MLAHYNNVPNEINSMSKKGWFNKLMAYEFRLVKWYCHRRDNVTDMIISKKRLAQWDNVISLSLDEFADGTMLEIRLTLWDNVIRAQFGELTLYWTGQGTSLLVQQCSTMSFKANLG